MDSRIEDVCVQVYEGKEGMCNDQDDDKINGRLEDILEKRMRFKG